jgi:hypothetical protein
VLRTALANRNLDTAGLGTGLNSQRDAGGHCEPETARVDKPFCTFGRRGASRHLQRGGQRIPVVAPANPHLVRPARRDDDVEFHTCLDRKSDLRKLETFVTCTASPVDRIRNTAGSATGDCHNANSNSVRRHVRESRTGADSRCAFECLSERNIHWVDVRAVSWRSFDRRRRGDGGRRRARGDRDQADENCSKYQRVHNSSTARPVHSARICSHGVQRYRSDYDNSICSHAGIHSPESPSLRCISRTLGGAVNPRPAQLHLLPGAVPQRKLLCWRDDNITGASDLKLPGTTMELNHLICAPVRKTLCG